MSKKCFKQDRDTRFRNAKGRLGGHFDRLPVVLREDVLKKCQELPIVKNLYVTHIGAFTSAPKLHTDRPNGFHTSLLIYCLQGKGFLEMEGQTMTVSQGQAFLIPKHVPHVYGANNRAPWSNFWIHFDGEQADDVIELLSVDKSHPILYVPDISLMRHLFENIYVCLKRSFTDEGLLVLNGEFLRFITNMRINMHEPPYKIKLDYGNLADTINFMNDHLNTKLDYEDLVAYSNQSKSQLFRHFKENTGQSPIEFFIHLKMERACEMLEETELFVKDVADHLGYEDPYYFSRVFKKIIGCSPSEYKEKE